MTRRAHVPIPVLAAALALLVAAPAAGFRVDVPALAPAAASGGPDDQHRMAEELCRTADPMTILLGSAAALDARPAAVPDARPPGDLHAAVADLYATLGLATADLAIADVPPAVAAPVSVLVQAMADAARLHALAVADLDSAQLARLAVIAAEPDLALQSDAPLVGAYRLEHHVAATALLLDAVDEAAPLIDEALAAGQWPKDAPIVADPLGLIRIGSAGNDEETIARALVVDPAGDDVYRARMGAGGPTAYVGFLPVGSPVGLAVDISGNDRYLLYSSNHAKTWGWAGTGVGVMLDLEGADRYDLRVNDAAGVAGVGVGLFFDAMGNDVYTMHMRALGAAAVEGLGLAIDAAGTDTYALESGGGMGYGNSGFHALGSLCDAGGSDSYTGPYQSLGYAEHSPAPLGWFADVGGLADTYSVQLGNPATDNNYWTAGFLGGLGRGLDI